MIARLTRDEIFDADGALTARFLMQRGYCCGNGCRNCPYQPRHGGAGAVLRAEIAAQEGILDSAVDEERVDATMESS
jgi:hypothetical protein